MADTESDAFINISCTALIPPHVRPKPQLQHNPNWTDAPTVLDRFGV